MTRAMKIAFCGHSHVRELETFRKSQEELRWPFDQRERYFKAFYCGGMLARRLRPHEKLLMGRMSDWNPDVIILFIGDNDIDGSVPPCRRSDHAAFVAGRILTFINRRRFRNVRVIVVPPIIRYGEHNNGYNIIRGLVYEQLLLHSGSQSDFPHVSVLPLRELTNTSRRHGRYFRDRQGVHLSSYGYRRLFREIIFNLSFTRYGLTVRER